MGTDLGPTVKIGTWEFTSEEFRRLTPYELAWLRRSEAFDRAGLTPYDIGPTPFVASRLDPRCSFCLLIPESYDPDVQAHHPVVVAVHGTDRPAQEYRDRLAPFAEAHDCIVVAPLFPAGLSGPWEIESYKLMRPEDLRSDLVLIDMLEMIGERFGSSTNQILLHGFSGGAQFVQRFLLLHPERIRAASIAAPGLVTLLDAASPWWIGVRDMERRFGRPLDEESLRRVPVQLLVGEADSYEVAPVLPEEPEWMPGANDAGRSRIDRLRSLETTLTAAGVTTEFEIVPGVGHEGWPLLGRAESFFSGVLSGSSTEGKST